MSKFQIVKIIVKLYFVVALAASFTHIVTAAEKLGLHDWEAGITPWLIDGMFVLAMILRHDEFSTRVRRIGLRTQVGMGALSLAANVYAATAPGGVVLAVLVIGGMIFSEWLGDARQMQTAAAEAAELAAAEAERIARQAVEDAAARKAAGIAKGRATRARNARIRKTQVKALESMLNA